MWTPATRRRHSRAGLRYASGLAGNERRVLEPLPPGALGRGRRWAWPLRETANAIFCVLRAGCVWRLLPGSFPPWRTGCRRFVRLRGGGVFEAINRHLVVLDRGRAGRDASPAAAAVDRQSVKTAESGGPRGCDAGKEAKGRQRHAMVDTDGRGLALDNHPAGIQDRDGAPLLLRGPRRRRPFVQLAFMDSGYVGGRVARATAIRAETVREPKDQAGFAVHARRWAVERFFAWIGRSRRLAKDFEATIASANAFLCAASVIILRRRTARST